MLLEAAERVLPAWFKNAQIARLYNLLTGANFSHLDIAHLTVFERDEVIGLINHADLFE